MPSQSYECKACVSILSCEREVQFPGTGLRQHWKKVQCNDGGMHDYLVSPLLHDLANLTIENEHKPRDKFILH